MSDAVVISLISAASSIFAGIIGLANNYIARKNAAQIENLEKNTNSMKDELVKVTGLAAYGRGLQVGTDKGVAKGIATAEALEAARQQIPPVAEHP
jgi:hypothetical protein